MSDHLTGHAARLKSMTLAALAQSRAGDQPLSAAGWQANLARHRLDRAAETALLAFGCDSGLEAAAQRLFSGAPVNVSEDRPALHWALRGPRSAGEEAERVAASLTPALSLAARLRNGTPAPPLRGPFSAIVHIGIGGSDFGPRLIADAFSDGIRADLTLRFAANVDPFDLDRALAGLEPSRTLIIGVSKSFGTEETLYNLSRARNWLAEAGCGLAGHLVLVSANPARARSWAGEDIIVLDMPLSVGGRFSIWSAASLVCMVGLGPELFKRFLYGAAAMDAHAAETPLDQNLPMRLALVDYWNTSVLGHPMRVLLAYASRLRLLPAYLQQLEMESNGKSVGPLGEPAPVATAPALWGGEGSIGQHSYHQWLHQGSHPVPCEFVLAPDRGRDRDGLDALTAHALAQAEVLANGRSLAEVVAEEPGLAPQIAAQKVHPGGRASTVLWHEDFGPEALGALIALYEHRTYFAGHLWGLNSFDQWGVERGKTMAGRIRDSLVSGAPASDAVTAALMRQMRR